MSMTNRFALWRSPLAGGPILVLLVFVFRSLTPMFDATVASISGVLSVVVAFMLAGQRWAGMAFLVLPIALFASPAGREFSFNLSARRRPDLAMAFHRGSSFGGRRLRRRSVRCVG